MRSGPERRCASYCTWSSRSRTTVLESADDQCRIPVTFGNFDNSWGVAGALSGSPASDITSELGFAVVVEFAFAAMLGAAGSALSFTTPAPAGLTGIFSV